MFLFSLPVTCSYSQATQTTQAPTDLARLLWGCQSSIGLQPICFRTALVQLLESRAQLVAKNEKPFGCMRKIIGKNGDMMMWYLYWTTVVACFQKKHDLVCSWATRPQHMRLNLLLQTRNLGVPNSYLPACSVPVTEVASSSLIEAMFVCCPSAASGHPGN